MRTLILKIMAMTVVGLGLVSMAAAQSGGASSTSSKKASSQQVDFEDLLVQGKYHFSDEAVTTVEQDKILDSLLQVRKDFQDRVRQSAKQE